MFIIHFASQGQIRGLPQAFHTEPWFQAMLAHAHTDKALQLMREATSQRQLEALISREFPPGFLP